MILIQTKFNPFGAYRPQTPQELFNLRHAKARNVIERVFGVLKKRFPVLTSPAPYSIDFQRDIVIALCTVHNFIRLNGGASDAIDFEAEEEYIQGHLAR